MPAEQKNSPMLIDNEEKAELSEREILYKVLFDMKKDIAELKKITFGLMDKNPKTDIIDTDSYPILKEIQQDFPSNTDLNKEENKQTTSLEIEESLSLFQQEKKLIEKALKKHKGKRRSAAKELGISERTLYRKLKEFDI